MVNFLSVEVPVEKFVFSSLYVTLDFTVLDKKLHRMC